MHMYLNGECVFSHEYEAGADGAHSIEPGGVLLLGYETDSPWGDLEMMQSIAGYFDEVRVWSTVRNASQIKANYQRSIDIDNDPDASDLNLYYRFDSPGGKADGDGSVEQDLSMGGACDGLVGAMPTIENVMQVTGIRQRTHLHTHTLADPSTYTRTNAVC